VTIAAALHEGGARTPHADEELGRASATLYFPNRQDFVVRQHAGEWHPDCVLQQRTHTATWRLLLPLHQRGSSPSGPVRSSSTGAPDDSTATESPVVRADRFYEFLVEHVPDVIWIADADLRLTYVSRSVTRLPGYTPEEAPRSRQARP
jgi:PAS domain-containing protein